MQVVIKSGHIIWEVYSINPDSIFGSYSSSGMGHPIIRYKKRDPDFTKGYSTFYVWIFSGVYISYLVMFDPLVKRGGGLKYENIRYGYGYDANANKSLFHYRVLGGHSTYNPHISGRGPHCPY